MKLNYMGVTLMCNLVDVAGPKIKKKKKKKTKHAGSKDNLDD
jgi:hypothetical protein